MSQLTIYSASAGSGKTYTLTLEYLTLALADDDPAGFKPILAVTFTNAAASEMKQRIVASLRQLHDGSAPALLAALTDRLADRLRRAGFVTLAEQQGEVQRRAGQMFQRVLYDYADFAVGTIDSFGQRIVTSFARELGLPSTFEVELDTTTVLAAAVGLLLDQVNRPDAGADPALTTLLREYADEAGAEGRSLWRLAETVADFSQALFNDTHLEVVQHLTSRDVAWYQQFREAAKGRLAEIDAQVEALGGSALQLIEAAGLTEKHLARGATGIYGFFRQALRKWQAGEEPNSYVRDTIENDNWTSTEGKKSPYRERLEGIKGELRAIYDELMALRAQHQGGYLLLRAMQSHALSVALLGEVQKLVADISRERGVVLIGEFNRRIAGVVLREPVPFVYEKLGERYQHLLLDEFQDTSALQWHNLLPLIENSLGTGYRSLAVGDAKQAIYRWRGGELEQIMRLYRGEPEKLLEKVRDPETRDLLAMRYAALHGALAPETLTENWRSRPEIVAFNNFFFTYLSTRWASQLPLLGQLYDDNFQQRTPDQLRAGPAGHVEVLLTQEGAPALAYDVVAGAYKTEPLPFHQPGEALTYTEANLNLTLALIEQARADGFALEEIAVLCRTRGQSREVAKLLKERDYPIISADSLALSFADSVNLLVNLLRVLHQPADGQARVAALLLRDKLVTGREPAPERLARIGALAAPQEPARPFWREINVDSPRPFEPTNAGNLGLFELAEQLVSALDLLAHAPAEAEYVFGFLDLTLDYSLRFGNNLGGFLDFWEVSGRNQAISTPAAGRDAVTIQTVHKAKGLAYGVVIVPFADWSLRPRAGSLLWGALPPDAELPIADMPPAAVVTHAKTLAATPLGAQYDDELARTFLEVLNLLYVAFTRPRHRLYVITKQAEKLAEADKLPGSVTELLHDVLSARGWEPGQSRFVFAPGDPAPAPKAQDVNLADPIDRAPWTLHNLAATPWNERLQLKRHATTVFDFATQRRQRELSLRLHLVLKRLGTAADIDRALHQLTVEGVLRPDEHAELREHLDAIVLHPRLAPYFAPGALAETERAVLLNEPGGQVTDYQPDRLIFAPDHDAVTLLDFRPPPPDAQHLADQRRHAELFRRLGYARVEGLIYYFETGEIVSSTETEM